MKEGLLPLWKHQENAIKVASDMHDYALFFEMGTGKSRTLIEILRHKFNRSGKVMKTIILCPPLVIPNWKDEWAKYSSIDMRLVIPLYGTGVKRLATFGAHAYEMGHSFVHAYSQGAIFITNYESLLMDPLFEAFQEWAPEVLALDESHKCKSHSAARSKRAYELANPYDRRNKRALPKPHTYLLSGSPVLNSPIDIFQQFKILDGGESFGWSMYKFRDRYFIDRNVGMKGKANYFPKYEVMTLQKDGIDAVSMMNHLIFKKAMRVEKKDCLDLPPEVNVVVKVGMTRDQERLYKELKNDFITFYNSKACTVTLAITKALRLLQITSGFVAVEHPERQEDAPTLEDLGETPKLTAFKQLLEEILDQDQKVLVWAVYRHNYITIRNAIDEVFKKLNLKNATMVEVHGEISDAKKRENVKKFQDDPNCLVFMGHPGSGGIGINLVQAAYSIFYSRTFNLAEYLQARARNHRGGSKEMGHEKITHYDLVCEETIDDLAIKKLEGKLDMSERMLADIASEIANQTN